MLKLISLQLPEELIDQLKQISKENSITMSALIRIVLLDYVRSKKENR